MAGRMPIAIQGGSLRQEESDLLCPDIWWQIHHSGAAAFPCPPWLQASCNVRAALHEHRDREARLHLPAVREHERESGRTALTERAGLEPLRRHRHMHDREGQQSNQPGHRGARLL
jgi:hypothetical protein